MAQRVAIIGAGMSGLLACKYVASRGFNPIVFESENQVGGLWNHTIETTRLQSTKDIFRFSDFPWPASVEDTFPRAAQMLEYLISYAEHFDLLPYIRFNNHVLSIDYVGGESQEEMESWELWGGKGKAFESKGVWQIKVVDTKEDSIKNYEVEFVVLCIGRFSGLPNIPEFPVGSGPEVFSGKVLHSMNYSAMDNAAAAEFIRGKHVVIIGSGKSALDIANECAIANGIDRPCTMIIRNSHWSMPDYHPCGVNGYLLFSRLSEMMVHKPGEGRWDSALTAMMSPLKWGISKFVEGYLRWKLPLKKYGMIPKESFVQECSSCAITLLPDKFYDKVEDGSIVLKKIEKYSFCKDGLVLDGEDKPLSADVVIFATGYKGDQKLKNIFAAPSLGDAILGTPISVLPLFRQIIHPRIPQLAVIGYAESLCNIYTFEMKSKWLASFLGQTFGLPTIKEMEQDIEDWDKFMKRYSINNQYRRACLGTIQICYNDQLCNDMGFNPRRKKGLIRDLLDPYSTVDYEGL